MSDVVPTPRSTTLQDLDLHLPPRQHFLRVLSENAESVGGTAWYIVLLDEAGPRTLIGSVGACGLPDDSGTIVIGDSQTVAVIVAERHPLQPHDAADTEFAQSLPCRYRLVHHVSLEDPLMRMFAVLGFLLDRLPVSRRLWAAVYIVASVSLGAGGLSSFPSLERTIAKNGSISAYAFCAANLGMYVSVLWHRWQRPNCSRRMGLRWTMS